MISITFNTVVCDLEVRLEIVVARLVVLKVVIQNTDVTRPSPRAVTVHDVDDVNRAADVSKVLLNALTYPHPSVVGGSDEQNLVWFTFHPEVLRLTVRLLHGAI